LENGMAVQGQVTLEMIYGELLRVSEKLSAIEDVIEEIVVKDLPEASVNKEKIKKIKQSISTTTPKKGSSQPPK